MGLYLQRNQEIPSKSELCSAGSLCCHHDSTLHGCIRQAADQNLPQKRRSRYGQSPVSQWKFRQETYDVQGGMAAQIPIKNDKEANDAAMANVYADKLREVRAGHDGTWVAHPALASIASEVFNKHMPTPNQMFVRREDVKVTGNDLLNMNMPGTVTEEGIRKNLNIGLGYMEGWLKGIGCVPINFLMVRTHTIYAECTLLIGPALGGCRDCRSQPKPALAMVSPRNHHCRRKESGQAIRPEASQGASR